MEEKNVQEKFLVELCKQSAQVSVFLASGIQLRGIIKGFDAFVILLEKSGVTQMVYKHAISTVVRHQAFSEVGNE